MGRGNPRPAPKMKFLKSSTNLEYFSYLSRFHTTLIQKVAWGGSRHITSNFSDALLCHHDIYPQKFIARSTKIFLYQKAGIINPPPHKPSILTNILKKLGGGLVRPKIFSLIFLLFF